MESPYWNVTITGRTDASVNGVPVDMVVPNVYSSVFLHLATISRRIGTPVLARGTDMTKGGEVTWFTVDADGNAQSATPAFGATTADQSTPVSASPSASSWSSPPPPPLHSTLQPTYLASRAEPTPIPRPQHMAPAPSEQMPPGPAPMRSASPTPRSATASSALPLSFPAPSQSSALFVQPPKAVPQSGLRGTLYRLTAGRVNLGPSRSQIHVMEQQVQISRPLERPYSTAFLSFKGGIGKTSTTVGVGLTLAQLRGAPPIAIDANPDSGDLAERLLGEEELGRIQSHTITDLVRGIDHIQTWTDLSRNIMQCERLHVVAGEQDPAVSDSLTAEGYWQVHKLVRRFFSVILTDCGTGVTHNAMRGILAKADSVVIAAGYAVSSAKRAANTLDWLAQHGYGRLAQEAIVVLTDKDGVSARVHKETLRNHLAAQSKHVFVVPNDPAIADGDRISLERVRPRTREAWAEIAAALIDGYR